MVDEHPLAVALLAVLVVLAGCDFPPTGTQTPAGTPTPMASPTDVDTQSSSAADGVHEGLAADGIVDATALIDAHERVLADADFTTRRNMTARYGNGTLYTTQCETARYATSSGHSHVVRTVDGRLADRYGLPVRYEEWSNGSTTVSRANTTTDVRYSRGGAPGPGVTYRGRLFVVLSGMESADVTPTTVNGSRAYRVVDRNVSNPRLIAMGSVPALNRIETVRDVAVAAILRQDGLIQHVVVRYTVETGTTTIVVGERIRFTEGGSVTVPRPAWVPTALNQTSELD